MAQWLKKKISCQCRRREFAPWPGKIPHAVGWLSPCTSASEAGHPGAGARAPQQSSRCAPRLEEAQAQWQRPSTASKVIHFVNCQTVFRSCWFILHHKCMSFNWSKYLAELTMVHPFNFARSSGCEVVSHSGVDLYSSDNRRCWTSFHMLVIHPCSFGQVLFKLLPNFFFFFCPTFS